ncbi:MAG: MFS transporter [Burkholderiales bacterium]
MLIRIYARYRAFLRAPGLVATFALTWVARTPIATVTLGMLLHVQAMTGSFAEAGATVGSYFLAMACVSPFVGRIVDRRGHAGVLAVTGTVCPLALFAILFAQPLALSMGAMMALAAVAGAFAPPIVVLTRSSLRQRFDDERDRSTAFALDTVLVELAFTLGPLALAALLAAAGATAAFGFACCLAVLAAPMFALSPAARYLVPAPDAPRHWLGPLTDSRLVALFLVIFLLTSTFGLLEVGYPAYGTAEGSTARGATLIAVNSVGSAIGGLVYGGVHLPMPATRQLAIVLAAMTVPLALQGSLPALPLLALLAFLGGLLIAPGITLVMTLVSRYAPSHYATEAFTWVASAIVAGIGAGSAAGGRLVETFGAAGPFVAAAVSCGVALVVAARIATLESRHG